MKGRQIFHSEPVVFGTLSDGRVVKEYELSHEESGRALQVFTTAAGVQVYTGNALPNGLVGKHRAKYGPMVGVCFETQGYPDSPNHPEFPDIMLDRNSVYESTTVFRFLVRDAV